jgi:hypothetical protein
LRNDLRNCANFGTIGEDDRSYEKTTRTVLCESGGTQADIQMVEFGWPLGRPHCAPLGKGLWEVRSALGNNRIARVIFCMGDGHMILLHGFIKKTRKTPRADFDLALKRKKEVT